MSAQVKLLRVLEEGALTRVGESRPRKVDVRVVAATNRDILKEIAEKRFREDLYYRLNVVALEMPPLRDRPDDVEPIARYVLAQFARKTGRLARGFDAEALEMLRRYSWPGNARELRNVVQHGVLLCKGELLTKADLHFGPGDSNATGWSDLWNSRSNRLSRDLNDATFNG